MPTILSLQDTDIKRLILLLFYKGNTMPPKEKLRCRFTDTNYIKTTQRQNEDEINNGTYYIRKSYRIIHMPETERE